MIAARDNAANAERLPLLLGADSVRRPRCGAANPIMGSIVTVRCTGCARFLVFYFPEAFGAKPAGVAELFACGFGHSDKTAPLSASVRSRQCAASLIGPSTVKS